MVLCRFFQQGCCKYGNNCRFEHPAPQYGGAAISPLLRQSQQQSPIVHPPRNAPANNPFRPHGPPNKKDARDIFNLMLQDINEAEKGGVWPLSCYNFWPVITHGNNVPGLEDLSPEEMRHLQMQAQAAGSLDACNQQIQQMYQQARAKFNSLKVQTPETLALIESLTRGPATTQARSPFPSGGSVAQDSWPSSAPVTPYAQGQPSIFGGGSGQVVGMPTQAQNSAFLGASNAVSPGFGMKQPSVFGGTSNQQQSVFGAPTPFASLPKNQSIFGGTASAQQTQPSVFGGAVQPTQPSPFGGTAQQTQAAAFGASAQSYGSFGGNHSQASIFGGNAAQQTPAFGAAPSVGQSSAGIFGGASTAAPANPSSFSFANAFGATPTPMPAGTAQPFGAPVANNTSVFGGNVSQQTTGSIFGGGYNVPQNSSLSTAQGNNITLYSTIYSTLDSLSEMERKEFEAETFTLGKIPMHPPPRELT